MSGYILAAAAIILVCLLLSKLSGRMGVPTLALFILLGMLVGSDGLLKIHFDDFIVSGNICTIALIFIIFYGGFGTNWNHARHVAVKATLLSSLGVILTAVLTGGFCHYVLGIGMLESILVGAIISSTDAASVFSILRSKKLSLKYGTSSLLEVESGSNDPFSYMMTVIVLSAMKGNFDGTNLLTMIVQQVFLGVAFGAAAGLLSAKMLSRFRMSAEVIDDARIKVRFQQPCSSMHDLRDDVSVGPQDHAPAKAGARFIFRQSDRIDADHVNLIEIRSGSVCNLPGTVPGIHIMGRTNDDVRAVISRLPPYFRIIPVCTYDHTETRTLGPSADGTALSGSRVFKRYPRVHLDIPVYDLTDIVHDDRGILIASTAIGPYQRVEYTPDRQIGTSPSNPLPMRTLPREDGFLEVNGSKSLEAGFREHHDIHPWKSAHREVHILQNSIHILREFRRALCSDRSKLHSDDAQCLRFYFTVKGKEIPDVHDSFTSPKPTLSEDCSPTRACRRSSAPASAS